MRFLMAVSVSPYEFGSGTDGRCRPEGGCARSEAGRHISRSMLSCRKSSRCSVKFAMRSGGMPQRVSGAGACTNLMND